MIKNLKGEKSKSSKRCNLFYTYLIQLPFSNETLLEIRAQYERDSK